MTIYDSLRFPVSSAGIRGDRLLITRTTHGAPPSVFAPVHSGIASGALTLLIGAVIPNEEHAARQRRDESGTGDPQARVPAFFLVLSVFRFWESRRRCAR